MRSDIQKIIEKELITSKEAARMLGIDESQVRRRILSGKLKAIKKGTTWLIDRQDIQNSD